MPAVLLVLLAVPLTGCFQSGEGPGDPPAPPAAPSCVTDPIGWFPEGAAGHDHRDLAHHRIHCNMTMLAHHPMVDQEGEFAGAHAMDVHGELVVVSVEYGNAGRGFDLFDVSDPGAPVRVGSYRDSEASGGDRNVAFSADGRFVFMANEAAAQSAATSAGVRVVDVSDPSNPRFVSFTVIAPNGVHTVEAFTVGGRQFVAALNFGIHFLELRPDALGTMRLFHVGRFATATPEQIAAHPDVSQTTIQRSIYGHDTHVQRDPITGRTLLYFSGAYDGVTVLDVSDPATPLIVARWVPQDADAPHYVHDTKAFVNASGRRIMVVEAETFEDRHLDVASTLWFVDVTDFSQPRELAKWVNPGGHGSDRLGLSTHFFRILDEHIVLSHYHGGVWILNATDAAKPTVAAYYQPSVDTGYTPSETCCIGWNLGFIPMTFDVEVDARGNIYAADFATGFYVLQWNRT